jgi:Fe-S-cluster containining protein
MVDSCIDCGICCEWDGVTPLSSNDCLRLAEGMKIPINEFLQNYTVTDNIGVILVSRSNEPCVFYSNGRCTQHEFRPDVCRNFPEFSKITVSLLGKCRLARYIFETTT